MRCQLVYSVVIFSHRFLDSDCINFKTFAFLAVYWPLWTSLYSTDIKVQKKINRSSTMLNNVFKFNYLLFLSIYFLFLDYTKFLYSSPIFILLTFCVQNFSLFSAFTTFSISPLFFILLFKWCLYRRPSSFHGMTTLNYSLSKWHYCSLYFLLRSQWSVAYLGEM